MRITADLPQAIRKETHCFALRLARKYDIVFSSNPALRKRAGQFLTALLPPKPRRRGRPGRPDVTKAIRLLPKFRRQFPNERPAQHWATVYPLVIAGYAEMNHVEERDAQQRLKERVQ